MASIEIDFEVFKALTAKRRSEETSYNDVLRELLGLGKSSPPSSLNQNIRSISGKGDLICKGVVFPEGTDFRALYKGKYYYAKAVAGTMHVIENNFRAPSPSAGAFSITNSGINGWRFWECKFPNQAEWISLDLVRHNLLSNRA